MIESAGLFKGLPKTTAIFDMAAKAADPWIEDVFEGIFSEKQITDYPQALTLFASP